MRELGDGFEDYLSQDSRMDHRNESALPRAYVQLDLPLGRQRMSDFHCIRDHVADIGELVGIRLFQDGDFATNLLEPRFGRVVGLFLTSSSRLPRYAHPIRTIVTPGFA